MVRCGGVGEGGVRTDHSLAVRHSSRLSQEDQLDDALLPLGEGRHGSQATEYFVHCSYTRTLENRRLCGGRTADR